MGIEEDIRAALLADATVAGLIGARVYPTKIPPNDAPPPWIYFTITSESATAKVGINDQAKSTVEFELFAATYAECRALKLASRAALNGYVGGHIRRMLWAGSDSGPVENGHNITERYAVWGSTPTLMTSPPANARIVTGTGRIDLFPNGSGVEVWIDDEGKIHGDGSQLAGIDGAPEIISIAFAHGDASSAVYTMPDAGRVVVAVLTYRVAFDQPSATVLVGLAAGEAQICAAGDSSPSLAGGFEVTPDTPLEAGAEIWISINPAGSVAGSGVLTLFLSFV